MSGARRGFGKLRKLPSGRWQASYVGPDGIRRNAPTTFAAKMDAEGWLSRRRNEITDGEWLPQTVKRRAPITFETYANTWLERRELKPRTREHYQTMMDKFLVPTFGKMPMREISPEDVARWHHTLDTGSTYKAHAYGLMRTICKSAVNDGTILTSPCRVEGGGQSRRLADVDPPTLEELRLLVDALPDNLRAAALVAAWVGLRFGELFELRRRDVDLNAAVIHVRRAVTRVDGKPVVGTPKSSAGRRAVNVPPHIIPVLREHMREHSQPGRDGLVFPNAQGEHWTPSQLYSRFYPARRAAGRPDLKWHTLRHFSAVMAARAGATLKELQDRLGHSTVTAALRYQHSADERDRALAARLSTMAEET